MFGCDVKVLGGDTKMFGGNTKVFVGNKMFFEVSLGVLSKCLHQSNH